MRTKIEMINRTHVARANCKGIELYQAIEDAVEKTTKNSRTIVYYDENKDTYGATSIELFERMDYEPVCTIVACNSFKGYIY